MKEYDGSVTIGTSVDLVGLKKDLKAAERELRKLEKQEVKLRLTASEQSRNVFKQNALVDKYRKSYGESESFKQYIKDMNIEKGSGKYFQKLDERISAIDPNYEKILTDLHKFESEYAKTMDELNAKSEEVANAENKLSEMQSKIGASGEIVSKFGSKMKTALVAVSKGMIHLTKNTLSAINPLKRFAKIFNSAFRMGKFMIIHKLFNAIFKQAQEGFKSLGEYSTEFNSDMKRLNGNFKYIGNSIVTAIAPALRILIPIFNAITDSIVGVINMLAQLTARLTGNATTFTRAKKSQEGYAAATDKANKAQEKQLASFDTIQKLGNKSSSGAGSNASDMFEEAEIQSNVIDFADRIKEDIAAGNWEDIGALLADKLSNALDSINWSKIKSKAQKIGSNLARVINGFVEFPDIGNKIGSALAEGINVAFEFAYGFVTSLHWDSVGIFIGDMITGAIAKFDWTKAGTTIGTGVGGLIQMIGNAIATTDLGALGQGLSKFVINLIRSIAQKIRETPWNEVGAAIADFFLNIDYAGIALSVAEFILNSIGSINDLIVGFFTRLGENSGEGLLGGMLSILGNIVEFVGKIVTGIVDAFKTLLGIHSPSTVFAEIGMNIMLGLLNGITDFLGSIIDFFTNMWNTITESVNSFASDWNTAISNWWNNDVSPWFTLEKWAELGSNMIAGIKNGITGIVDTAKNIGSDLVDGVKNFLGIHSPSTKFEYLGSFLMPGLANGIMTTMQNVMNAMEKVTNMIKQMWETVFQTKGEYSMWFFSVGKKMMSGLIMAFKNMMDALKLQLNELLSAVRSTMNAAASAAQSAASSIRSAVASARAALAELESMEASASSSSIVSGGKSRMLSSSILSMDLSGIEIPKLASGDIAMPNNPYLAMLGDNKTEKEVVSPLSTIEQAVRNVIGDGRNITIVLELNDREFGRAVYKANNQESQRVGVKLAKGGSF